MLTEKTIFRGAFWFSIGAVLERIIYFLLPVFIAPLGPRNLGIFHLSLRIFHAIVFFPTTAFNTKYTNRLRQYLENPRSLQFEETAALLLKVYFLVGLLLGILFFILTLLTPLKSLVFLALSIPLAIVNSYTMLVLRLLQRFKKIFFIQAVFIFGFQLLYVVIFIKVFHMGIMAVFICQLLISVLVSLTAIFFLFDRINLLGIFGKLNLKMFKLSPLSSANVLFATIHPIIDISLVALLFGFTALGRYTVLLYLPLFIHKIPATLFSMFLHVAAIKTYNNEDITQVSKRVFKWILIISIPVFIVIMIYPSAILSILFHKSYVKDFGIIRLLAISSFAQSFSWITGRILLAKKKNLSYASTNYLFLLLFISIALPLGLIFGLYGIAIAQLVSSVLDAFIKYILVIKRTNILFIDSKHIKIIFSGALGGFFAYILFSNNLLLFFSFFTILYLIILLIVGIVDKKAFFDFKEMVVKEVVVGESEYD